MEENKDLEYMQMALALAKEAATEGEVPVGAVLVFDGKVAGVGRNRREGQKNALCHAETGEVFYRYQRRPRFTSRKLSQTYIVVRKDETLGMLTIVKL